MSHHDHESGTNNNNKKKEHKTINEFLRTSSSIELISKQDKRVQTNLLQNLRCMYINILTYTYVPVMH